MKCVVNSILSLFMSTCLLSSAVWAQQVQAMKLLTPQVGWALGQHLYWTADSGTHWKAIDPHTVSKLSIVDAFFLNTSVGWALMSGGDQDANEPEFELASTTNAGGDWHVKRVRIPHVSGGGIALDGRGTVYFVDADHGWMNLWVVSSTAFRLGALLMTEDGGKTWKWAPDGSDAGAGTAYFIRPTDGWIAGGSGDQQLYVTHDGAKTWHKVALKTPSPITPEYTASYVVPTFHDRKHGFLPVTYTDGDDGEAILVLFASDDGGQNWKTDRVLPRRGYLSGENVPTTVADSVLLAAPNSSSDGAISLTIAPRGAKERTAVAHVSSGRFAISQLSFVEPSRGWVSCSNGLFSTQDAGVTWTNITPSAQARGGGHAARRHWKVGGVTGVAQPAPLVGSQAPTVATQLGFDKCPSPTLPQMAA